MTAVFYSADDCAKITPYIPKELLKDWEWWYKPGNHNDLFFHAQIKRGKFISPITGFRDNFPMVIPALDAQIVRESIDFYSKTWYEKTGREAVLAAVHYFIDNKLIKEAV